VSEAASLRAEAGGGAAAWTIRPARATDVRGVAEAVGGLLDELGGRRPSPAALEAEAAVLVRDPALGALLVAEAGGAIVGVLAASYLRAMHVPGAYSVIQDLWVDPPWRSRRVGAGLIAAIEGIARDGGMSRLEVGLPKESFAAIAATEGFYRRNGFDPLGPRMRRLLP
jgi:GNAT superfamily N-acetyltransferase